MHSYDLLSSFIIIDSPTKGGSSTPTYSPTCEGDCVPAPVPAEEEETTLTEPPVATTEEETTTTNPPVAAIPPATTEPPVVAADIIEEDGVVVDESEMSMPSTDEVIDSNGIDFAGATEAENTAASLFGSSIVVVAAGIATTWLM